MAGLYERGGSSPSGNREFNTKRPGWDYPIQELFERTKITAFVQGHDHVFARENVNGVAYITLPEPADPNYVLYNSGAYTNADIAPNSGRVRFTVSPTGVTVEYIRSWMKGDDPDGERAAGALDPLPAYSFTILPDGSATKGFCSASQNLPTKPSENELKTKSTETKEKPAKKDKTAAAKE